MEPKAILVSELSLVLGGTFSGDGNVRLTGISEDSRKVKPGDLFVVKSGSKANGAEFIEAATRSGALALLVSSSEKRPESGLPMLVVPELRVAFARAAQAFYGDPAPELTTIAVTGTNGKTTTTTLVGEALASLGHVVARIGTLGFFVGEERMFETLTTPGPLELARAMAEARERGARYLVLEASSHALDQGRLLGVPLEVAGFLNLTQDHLDYHRTMEAYGAAKARLFLDLEPKKSVIFAGNDFGRELLGKVSGALGVGVAGTAGAALVAEGLEFSSRGFSCRVNLGGARAELSSPLLGKHNLENLLVALGILVELGFSLEVGCRALEGAGRVPGRLERCDAEGDDLLVLVDYAHTPDALERVLVAIREVTTGPLWAVFGCGGDRDRAKRPLMGRVASRGADACFVTSDNPRSEDPKAIIEEIERGLEPEKTSFVEVDRRRAIELAIASAAPGTTVLIAGKGHETYQIVGAVTHDFDDRVVAREALAKRRKEARSWQP